MRLQSWRDDPEKEPRQIPGGGGVDGRWVVCGVGGGGCGEGGGGMVWNGGGGIALKVVASARRREVTASFRWSAGRLVG